MFVILFLISSFASNIFGFYLADLTLPKTKALEETEQYTYKKCLSMRKILYENQCWDLLTSGPCDKGQWLVLDSWDNGQWDQMKAKCTRRRCSESDVYWPQDGFCYDAEMMSRHQLCSSADTEVATDEFGDGYCQCRNDGKMPYVRVVQADDDYDDTAPCYSMYTRGPCPRNHVITPFGLGYGKCSEDVCAAERRLQQTSSFDLPLSLKSRRQAMKVPWIDGQCYELGTRGPCTGNEQFTMVRDEMRPGCVSPVTELDLFSNKKSTTTTTTTAVPQCETDHWGACVDGIDVQTSDPTFGFEEQLRESAKRHSKRNKMKRVRAP